MSLFWTCSTCLVNLSVLVSLCFFLFFVVSKLLIADSIAMQVDDVKGTRVQALPSTTVRQLIGDIALGVVPVGGFEAVLFHVGTHDVPSTGMGYRRSIDAVVEDFAALLDIVRDFNAHCQIVVSAILPRPVDHLLSWYRVQQVNQRLCSLCFSAHNVLFNPTYKFFVSHGLPVPGLFSTTDRLHLSETGVSRLRQAFQQALSPVNLAKANHCRSRVTYGLA